MDASSQTAPEPERCPVCGQINDCAIEAGLPGEECWCFQTSVSATALERIPEDLRGKACLCPRCAAGVLPEEEIG